MRSDRLKRWVGIVVDVERQRRVLLAVEERHPVVDRSVARCRPSGPRRPCRRRCASAASCVLSGTERAAASHTSTTDLVTALEALHREAGPQLVLGLGQVGEAGGRLRARRTRGRRGRSGRRRRRAPVFARRLEAAGALAGLRPGRPRSRASRRRRRRSRASTRNSKATSWPGANRPSSGARRGGREVRLGQRTVGLAVGHPAVGRAGDRSGSSRLSRVGSAMAPWMRVRRASRSRSSRVRPPRPRGRSPGWRRPRPRPRWGRSLVCR